MKTRSNGTKSLKWDSLHVKPLSNVKTWLLTNFLRKYSDLVRECDESAGLCEKCKIVRYSAEMDERCDTAQAALNTWP